ncbi:hypothetical protein CXB51_000514 [Gossypium anomalum]|uniref:AP-5 complex subunit zeta-1 C-terminal TPR domain-containing protein n=1 Tax=Gossypium anomalum TaxID=47600 RepID=A0A8J5ZR93_9ROSI|nr:hypothetical protein CXB51_000514 [Gossypium anomalum]
MVKLPYMIRILLALMDEAYTGSTIGDGGGDPGSEESCTIDVADPVFLELLKDENDGLAECSKLRLAYFNIERHWASPGVAAVLQAATNSPQSDRLKQILNITPRLLHMYFTVALRDANNTLICALIPILMARNSTLFPDKNYMYEVGRRLLEFMLASFQRSPDFIALLKTELALQLCWAVGEHGGGGGSHKDAARELFESLELLLYENLSSSYCKACCISPLTIAEGTCSLGQGCSILNIRFKRLEANSWLSDDPALCLSVYLGPSRPSHGTPHNPGTANWNDGDTKMIAHIPFYILAEQEGPPFHDFSFTNILPRRR